jgi:hypothetical protein
MASSRALEFMTINLSRNTAFVLIDTAFITYKITVQTKAKAASYLSPAPLRTFPPAFVDNCLEVRMRSYSAACVADLLSSLTRMADIPLSVKNSNLPAWLPTPGDVVLKCKNHGYGPSTVIMHSPDRSEAAFVKYGPMVGMGEARTQNYIVNIVNSDKDVVVLVPRVHYAFRHEGTGYILMQYVDGNDCNQSDYEAIVLAVNRLRSIPSPTTSPGPVGGGPVSHRFFDEHQSSIQYSSAKELQQHVNNVGGAF